jgi:transposase
MNQADRDRLVSLKKAKKKLITQKEAAEELGITERQVRRLLSKLKKRGDKAVVHALRGQPSNRKIDEKVQQQAVEILSQPAYRGFRPTLASEHLGKHHKLEASRETVRHWMMQARLWKARPRAEVCRESSSPSRNRLFPVARRYQHDPAALEELVDVLYALIVNVVPDELPMTPAPAARTRFSSRPE